MEAYLVTLITWIVNIITVVLILSALASFVLDPWHPARRFLNQFSEPILRPFRNLIPPTGMFDFSIMVALIVIQLLAQVLILIIRSSF